MSTCDVAVIGGGIVGTCIARELRRRFPARSVVLLDKELEPGAHASGRNSGVLHAGFYYSPDSLKARFTREGNRRLHAYCDEHGIPVNRCGKLVIALREADLPQLDVLLERGRANGVELHRIPESEAKGIEPRVKPAGGVALWSPSTSSVDPLKVLRAMWEDAEREGVQLRRGVAYTGWDGAQLHTSEGPLSAGRVVNAAGLQADRVARDFGFSEHYRILPFKGVYLLSSAAPGSLRCHVYPVPDLRNPFLGVHFTVAASGRVKIGPTAIPAFWREQYHGWDRFSFGEALEIVGREAALMIRAGFDFRSLAWQELRKLNRTHLVAQASKLVDGVREEDFREWGRPGIRAQLVDLRDHRLVMDYVIEGDERSLHVLNSVSPGFTSSMPFAEFVCDRLEGRTASAASA